MKVENLIALHQHDLNADWLWGYFAKVMEWVMAKFPFYRKEMASVEWGLLYNRYKADPRLASEIAYEAQGHKCAHCGREFAFESMQGDHIVPWSKGGKTTPDNLQMLCCECNNRKSAK